MHRTPFSGESTDLPIIESNQVRCAGMDVERLDELFVSDPKFCAARWKYSRSTDAFHALDCLIDFPLRKSTLESLDWKFGKDDYAQCGSCLNAQRNARRKCSEKLSSQSSMDSTINTIKIGVKGLYNTYVGLVRRDREVGIAALTNDANFVTSMKMLAGAGVYEVNCGSGDRARWCTSCHEETMVVRSQQNNAVTCIHCKEKVRDAVRKETWQEVAASTMRI